MADPESSTPRDNAGAAVAAAAEALRELLGEPPRARVTWPIWLAVAGVEVLTLGALVLHTFWGTTRWTVDSTTLGLLVIVLLTPLVPQLTIFEFAGLKAKVSEEQTRNIDKVVEVLELQQAAISGVYDGVVSEPESVKPAEVAVARAQTAAASTRTLDRVLWVDDHPENNAFEMDALAQVLRIRTATTNEEALTLLGSGEFDAVISDVFRDEDSPTDPSGPRLLRALRGQPHLASLPFVFYTGERSAASLADTAAEWQATVTTQFRALVHAIRIASIQADTVALTQAAREAGAVVVPNSNDLDLTVTYPDGRRIGIGVGSWLTRPQMAAFIDRLDPLTRAKQTDAIDDAWLVVRAPTIDPRRSAEARDRGIELLSATEALRRLGSEWPVDPERRPDGSTIRSS